MAVPHFALCLTPNEAQLLLSVLKQAAADRPPGATHATVAQLFIPRLELIEEAYAYGTGKTSVRSHSQA